MDHEATNRRDRRVPCAAFGSVQRLAAVGAGEDDRVDVVLVEIVEADPAQLLELRAHGLQRGLAQFLAVGVDQHVEGQHGERPALMRVLPVEAAGERHLALAGPLFAQQQDEALGAEGGAGGPLINFKGIGNETFYHLDPSDRAVYRDYTGCGNTVNCNHPLVAKFILECLEFWVKEMHVDGFRFDLASALARGEDGKPQYHAPVLWSIELSDTLAATRLVAEAWDAGGLYQVGGFPGFRWQEWNGRYRDIIRRFVRGDAGISDEVAMRRVHAVTQLHRTYV